MMHLGSPKFNKPILFFSVFGFVTIFIFCFSFFLVIGKSNYFVIGLLALLLSSGVGVTLLFVGRTTFHRFSRPSLLMILTIGLAGVVLSLGIVEIITYRLKIPHELTIIALGERQSESKGKEVWLIGRRHDFNRVLDTTDLEFSSGWQLRGRDIVASGNSPSVAYWKGKMHASGKLSFLTHPYSGRVEVIWDGEHTTYDLYSTDTGFLTLNFAKVSDIYDWLIFKCTFTMLLTFFLSITGMLLFVPHRDVGITSLS